MSSAPSPQVPFVAEFRVRYAECDSFGYLHHARYWVLFEQARTDQLRSTGVRYRDLEEKGVYFVVYKASCQFLSPIRYDDVIRVHIHIERTTFTRVDHRYEVFHGDDLTTKASTTLACVGRDGRPMVMPPQLWRKSSDAHR